MWEGASAQTVQPPRSGDGGGQEVVTGDELPLTLV